MSNNNPNSNDNTNNASKKNHDGAGAAKTYFRYYTDRFLSWSCRKTVCTLYYMSTAKLQFSSWMELPKCNLGTKLAL